MEASILLWIQEHLRNPILTPIMRGASTLGDNGILWIGIVLFLLLATGITSVKNEKTGNTENPFLRPAFICFFSMLICFVIGHLILKRGINRVRPFDAIAELTILVKKPLDASFPSGHSSISFSVATGLYLSLPKEKRWISIFALILAAMIAISRIYVGVHYPSDVLAGSLLGILCGFIAKKLNDKKMGMPVS